MTEKDGRSINDINSLGQPIDNEMTMTVTMTNQGESDNDPLGQPIDSHASSDSDDGDARVRDKQKFRTTLACILQSLSIQCSRVLLTVSIIP